MIEMRVQWDSTKHGESIEFLDENLTQKLGSHDFQPTEMQIFGWVHGIKTYGDDHATCMDPSEIFFDLRDAGFWSIQMGISQANKGDLTYIYIHIYIYICVNRWDCMELANY